MANKIYITGDKHGVYEKVVEFCKKNKTTKNDVLIILGDAGINSDNPVRDFDFKNFLSRLPITLFCIKGNHEVHPDQLMNYVLVDYFGAPAYIESEFSNLVFAKDGEIYDIDGKKCIAIGGAYSVDKPQRMAFGLPWYDTEQPSEETKKYVEKQLEKADWKIDYVLSHTCPKQYMPTWLFISGLDQSAVDNSTEEWMNTLEVKLDYKRWYFGHFHGSKEYAKFKMMYEEIEEFGKFQLEGDEPFKFENLK